MKNTSAEILQITSFRGYLITTVLETFCVIINSVIFEQRQRAKKKNSQLEPSLMAHRCLQKIRDTKLT